MLVVRNLLCALFLPLFICGCGSHAQKPTPPAGTTPYAAADHKGSIHGIVSWEGAVPERATIDFSSDPKISAISPKPVLLSEILVVENSKVQNAVVFLSSGTEKWIFPEPSEPVRVKTYNGRFEPHSVTLSAKQKLVFVNGNDFYQTVLGAPRRVNPEFNLGLHNAGDEESRTFEYPEMGFKAASDIRKWMACYVSIFYHPFHTVTKADGSFELKNVPDGEYTLSVWHENPDVQLPPGVTVQVKGGIVEQPFVLKKKLNL